MHNYRRPVYGGGRFFFGAPFLGGLLGGLVGSALLYPRPFYGGYRPYGPYAPYGPYGPYGYGYPFY